MYETMLVYKTELGESRANDLGAMQKKKRKETKETSECYK